MWLRRSWVMRNFTAYALEKKRGKREWNNNIMSAPRPLPSLLTLPTILAFCDYPYFLFFFFSPFSSFALPKMISLLLTYSLHSTLHLKTYSFFFFLPVSLFCCVHRWSVARLWLLEFSKKKKKSKIEILYIHICEYSIHILKAVFIHTAVLYLSKIHEKAGKKKRFTIVVWLSFSFVFFLLLVFNYKGK